MSIPLKFTGEHNINSKYSDRNFHQKTERMKYTATKSNFHYFSIAHMQRLYVSMISILINLSEGAYAAEVCWTAYQNTYADIFYT